MAVSAPCCVRDGIGNWSLSVMVATISMASFTGYKVLLGRVRRRRVMAGTGIGFRDRIERSLRPKGQQVQGEIIHVGRAENRISNSWIIVHPVSVATQAGLTSHCLWRLSLQISNYGKSKHDKKDEWRPFPDFPKFQFHAASFRHLPLPPLESNSR